MTKQYYQKHRTEIIARVCKRQRTTRAKLLRQTTGRFGVAKNLAKHAAKRAWSISKESYLELMKQPCYYCGEEDISYGLGLDRINNRKGYHLNNVLRCCGRCNMVRGHRHTVTETKVMIDALLEFRRNYATTSKLS